jgi:hypothetical protein
VALVALLALGLLMSCSASPTRLREPAPVQPAPVASGLDTGFRSVEARGQGLELLLPDADGWRHDPRDTRAWIATHASTRSRLLARTWRAGSIVRAGDCERLLRELRPDLPTLGREQQLERRPLKLAGDYAADLTTGAVASGERTAALAGHALLFGSDGRQCLALVFSTHAEGDTAARQVGDRLGIISRIFERVRRLDIPTRVVVPRP